MTAQYLSPEDCSLNIYNYIYLLFTSFGMETECNITRFGSVNITVAQCLNMDVTQIPQKKLMM